MKLLDKVTVAFVCLLLAIMLCSEIYNVYTRRQITTTITTTTDTIKLKK
jgi:TRAP-type C4-dicarboxylate transport system permease small subunit